MDFHLSIAMLVDQRLFSSQLKVFQSNPVFGWKSRANPLAAFVHTHQISQFFGVSKKIHQTKMEKTPPTKFQISCSNLQLLSAFFMSFIHFQNVQEMPTRSACHVFAGVCGDQFSLGFWWLKKSHVISILPGGGVGSSKGSRGFLNLEELMVLKKKTELMGVSLSHDLLRHHGGVIIRNTPWRALVVPELCCDFRSLEGLSNSPQYEVFVGAEMILPVRSRYLSRLLNLSFLKDAKSIYSGKLSERTPNIAHFSLLRDALFFPEPFSFKCRFLRVSL